MKKSRFTDSKIMDAIMRSESGKHVTDICRELAVRVIFRPVVAFLLIYQAAFNMLFGSFILGLFGLRCTSVIGSQFRVEWTPNLGQQFK